MLRTEQKVFGKRKSRRIALRESDPIKRRDSDAFPDVSLRHIAVRKTSWRITTDYGPFGPVEAASRPRTEERWISEVGDRSVIRTKLYAVVFLYGRRMDDSPSLSPSLVILILSHVYRRNHNREIYRAACSTRALYRSRVSRLETF